MTKTTKTALDMFCQLALESDLSDEQLTEYAALIKREGTARELEGMEATTPEQLVAQLKALTALEFAAAVKRSANGNATSTSNRFFRATDRRR